MEPSRTLRSELMLAVCLLVIGTIARYLFVGYGLQPFPNFEVIMVITFIGMLVLRPWVAFLIPLGCMIGSDILIGNPIFVGEHMNRIVLFTYSGFTLLAVVTYLLRNRLQPLYTSPRIRTIGMTAGLGVGFVLAYDCWTNLGWWYLLYPHTAGALGIVFTAGLPFMLYHILSAVFTFSVIAVPVLYLSSKHQMLVPHQISRRWWHQVPVMCLVVGLVTVSFTGMAATVPDRSDIWLTKSDSTSVTVTIQGSSWTVTDHVIAYPSDNAYSIMLRVATMHHLSVQAVYYAQFDAWLVNGIGSDTGHDSTYWQYYVNGILSPVGADHCPISNGQSLLWRFETVPS